MTGTLLAWTSAPTGVSSICLSPRTWQTVPAPWSAPNAEGGRTIPAGIWKGRRRQSSFHVSDVAGLKTPRPSARLRASRSERRGRDERTRAARTLEPPPHISPGPMQALVTPELKGCQHENFRILAEDLSAAGGSRLESFCCYSGRVLPPLQDSKSGAAYAGGDAKQSLVAFLSC